MPTPPITAPTTAAPESRRIPQFLFSRIVRIAGQRWNPTGARRNTPAVGNQFSSLTASVAPTVADYSNQE